MKMDLIICGVGGQGNLLASVAIANYAMKKNLNVVGSETIGAAQRGGSVVSHLRIADGDLYSAIIPEGTADILLGFEPMESLRHVTRLDANGKYVINIEPVLTVMCNMGMDKYPSLDEIVSDLNKTCSQGYTVNATQTARELGGVIMTNVVLLGVLNRVSDFFIKDDFIEVLKEIIPSKVLDVNLKAFEVGYNMVK